MEENKLIAEFMGTEWHKNIDLDFFKDVCIISSSNIPYKFHSSWDWLIPVVQKIEQDCEGVPQEMINIGLYSDINEVYKAAVQFIKNQNN